MSKNYPKFITLGSVSAVFIGLFSGILAQHFDIEWIKECATYFDFIGHFWVLALLILILPLAGSYIVFVFMSVSNTKEIGKLGGISIAVHSVNLIVGVAIGLGLGYWVIQLLAHKLPVFDDTTYAAGLLAEAKKSGPVSLENIVAVLKKMQVLFGKIVLYFIVGSIVSGLFLSRLKSAKKNFVYKTTEKISQKSFLVLQKFLLTLPLAVFSLLFVFFIKEGLLAAEVVVYWIVILSGLTLLLFVFQYIMVAWYGKISVKEFTKYIVPAQIIAMSTRSSLATMPALLDCAEKRMQLPKSTSGVIIPFFVTCFRVNYSVSGTSALLFLAYIFKVDLSVSTIIIFTLAYLLVSFGSPGIPSGGHYFTISLYLAAGLPIEGILLLKAIDQIPDIFKTLLNVTEVMAVTTVVAKIAKVETVKIEAKS